MTGPADEVGGDHDVVVVGGGVVGMALAHGLVRNGRGVTVLDEGDVAHRASRGNFALIWVQGKGFSMPAYADWTVRSADLWGGFAVELAGLTGIDVAYSRRGGFNVCLDGAELEERATRHKRLHNQLAAAPRFEVLDRAALRDRLPAIGPDVVGGTFCEADGHVNALRLFGALHEAASIQGVRYRPNVAVTGIEPHPLGVSVRTDQGEICARALVLAAGLGNARLAPMVGIEAPVRPQRGQVMVTEKVAPFLDYPLGTVRQTDEGGVMIGDSKEEVGLDNGSDSRVLGVIADRAVRTFPLLAGARIVRSWGALRVMSPDGNPIYDRSTSMPAYLVTCHSGVTLAAVHARVLAAHIADGSWPEEFEQFSARRFGSVPQAA